MNGKFQIEYFDIEIIIGEIDLVVSKACPSNWHFKASGRKFFGLVYIVSGSAVFSYHKDKFTARQGDIVFLEKGSSYTTRANGSGYSYILISFDIERLDKKLPFAHIIGNFPNTFQLFMTMEKIWFSKGICYNLEVRELIYRLLAYLIRHNVDTENLQEATYRNIRTTVDYMSEYYEKQINIEILAGIAGYSPSYYRKKFKEIFKCPPIDYLNEMRVEKAKILLKSKVFSQKEIAEICGFSNVYYFSKMFKKITGITPKGFSQSCDI